MTKLIKLFAFIFSFTIYNNGKSQNLVPNPSFEEFVDFSVDSEINWHKVQSSDTPDYFNFNPNSPSNCIFNKYMGNITPRNGYGFVGIFCYRVSSIRSIRNVREFIESPLLFTLKKDSLYKIELSVRLDIESNIAIKNFGIYFSDGLCSKNQNFKPLFVIPQVEFNSVFLDSTDSWITLQALYKASGNEVTIVLGNFRTDRKTYDKNVFFRKERGKRYKWDLVDNELAAYYYLDDINVQKIQLNQRKNVKNWGNKDTLSLDSLYNINTIEIDSSITLKNIIFEFNKSDLLPQSYIELSRLKYLMEQNPNIRIKLEGHTDNVGGYKFNLKLSVERAEAVVAYLINEGIDPSRIEYAGYSYSKPLVSNDTDEGRQINRRVVFKIISK